MSSCDSYTLTSGILAGGLSTRMGGRDKGLVDFKGQPLVAHLAATLRKNSDLLFISANRNQAIYRKYADTVITDAVDDQAGPLRGIQSLLSVCRTDYLLLAPCDTPALPLHYVERFRQLAEHYPTDCLVAEDGERRHPLHLWLPNSASLKEELDSFLDSGSRRAMEWVASLNARPCSFAGEAGSFRNLNSPEQLTSFLSPQ